MIKKFSHEHEVVQFPEDLWEAFVYQFSNKGPCIAITYPTNKEPTEQKEVRVLWVVVTGRVRILFNNDEVFSGIIKGARR